MSLHYTTVDTYYTKPTVLGPLYISMCVQNIMFVYCTVHIRIHTYSMLYAVCIYVSIYPRMYSYMRICIHMCMCVYTNFLNYFWKDLHYSTSQTRYYGTSNELRIE